MIKESAITFVFVLLSLFDSFSQSNSTARWLDSARSAVKEIEELRMAYKTAPSDSLAVKIFTNLKLSADTPFSLKPGKLELVNQSLKPVFNFHDGYVNYSYQYRSSIDTPFSEFGLSQHMLTGYFNLTIADKIPLTVTYFERQSNSKYFRDYRDIRVEFNQAEFKKLQSKKLQTYLEQLSGQAQDPMTLPSLNYVKNHLELLGSWMNGDDMIKKLIQSRREILNGGKIDEITFVKDTSLQKAKEFIAFYDKLVSLKMQLEISRDSLEKNYLEGEKLSAAIRNTSGANISESGRERAMQYLSGKLGPKFGRISKLMNKVSALQKFSFGKVLPNHSDLTLKNINITGINFEYYNKLYFALSAGAVDYRARDFFYAGQKRKPQFVYLTRVGYGAKHSSHLHLTGFKGKKQLLNSGDNPRNLEIYGLSMEAQVLIHKNHRLLAELAQSAAPAIISQNGQYENTSFKLSDEKNKAWTVKLNSDIPKTRSRLEAFYKYRGINFQSFSSYYANAEQYSWQVKASQLFWKRQVRLNASISRNNFENRELPVRYSGQTHFTSFSLFFNRKNWPSLQLGYMPASQLSEINGVIYENYYQSLNISVNYHYKIGLARSYSLISYHQFLNNSSDTGFIYYNARNYYFSQLFQFTSYGATVNISRSQSQDYTLTVFETGIDLKMWKRHKIGFGTKINQLNGATLRLGFYSSGELSIAKLGNVSAWIEKSYLPGWGNLLIRNEMFNIGFTRFFN